MPDLTSAKMHRRTRIPESVSDLSVIRASGGIVTRVGVYTIHTFLGDGDFEAFSSFNVEYLIAF